MRPGAYNPAVRDPTLRAYLRVAPFARAVIRSREVDLVSAAGLAPPIVDLGHGDGTFAAMLARRGVETAVGVDRDRSELLRARAAARDRGARIALVVADLERLPFRAGAFGGAVSNCVLEHVDDVPAALRETARVVRPRGRVAATVVADRYAALLAWPRCLGAIGLGRLGRAYGEALDRHFGHRRSWAPARWRAAFEAAGLRVEAVRPYVSSGRQAAMDLLLPTLLVGHLWRRLLGRYVLWPGRWSAVPVERLLGPEPEGDAEAANAYLVAQRP